MNRRHHAARAAGIASVAVLASCGSGTTGPSGPAGSGTILIGLNVPVTADPYVAGLITRGATLAVDQENAAGGVKVGGTTYKLTLKTYDDNNDPQKSAANVDLAIHDGAVAVIEDGIGASISASKSAAAGVAEIIITNGNLGLLADSNKVPLPSLFRLGIPNDAAAGLLGTYIASQTMNVAILHDDSENGRDGSAQLVSALGSANVTIAPAPIEVPAASPTIDAQVAQLAAAHPGGIALWGSDIFIAKAVAAIRAAALTVPIYTNQAGESPAVRLLDGPTATEGLRIVTGRMTSEGDATDFPAFEHALATDKLGPTDAGFKNAAGQEIRQPNDIDFFPYDSVHVIVAALQRRGSVTPGSTLLDEMSVVTVKSANGDARGYNSQSHEAFAAADVYIAGIHDMQFEPVKDETLSATLPTEDEILTNFH